MRFTLMICMVATAAMASSQTLSTGAPNNGSGGVFTDLTPLGGSLLVLSFDSAFSGTVGTSVDVEVWTRPGSYVGFDGSSAGWTLHETTSTVRAGTTVLSNMALVNPILLPSGATTAVYLHCLTSGGGVRYNGTSGSPPQTLWSNADLQLFSDVARTGNVPFGGSRFSPRAFAGNVNYAPVPEPASLGALALGAAALLRRRRKA